MTVASVKKDLDARHLWWWHTVVILTLLDPFGFESVTKRQSEKLIYKVYGAAYPSEVRNNISVVYLDNETLAYFKETWPPSHVVHSEILQAILDYKPAAVLIDFLRAGNPSPAVARH
jgi:CHASE2 domain-containing sensor protein